MTTNTSLQAPLLQRNDRGYGTTVITIFPETQKMSLRNLLELKQLIVDIAAFLPGDVYGQFEKVYNEFWQRNIRCFEKRVFGIGITIPLVYKNAHEQLTANKLNLQDRLLRAQAIADSHPTKQALNDFQILDSECRKIFEKEEDSSLPGKLLSLVGKLDPRGGEYAENADLYAAFMLKHLSEIIPSKSLVEFTSSEREPSARLHTILNTFLLYLNEAQIFADYQESIEEILKSLPRDMKKLECMSTYPLLKDEAIRNLAICLAKIIAIKENISGLQNRHIADLKTVSEALTAKGFPALALEILNPLALFEDPQHITLPSFTHIFDLWREASLAYLKKYPHKENIESMFARFNEMGKQVLTYGYPRNISLIGNTCTHLFQIMQEIHTRPLTEHKKLLSGNEAKILTGRLQKLRSYNRIVRILRFVELDQYSLKTFITISAIGAIIWLGSIGLTLWGMTKLTMYYNLNLPLTISLAIITTLFMAAIAPLIYFCCKSLAHRLSTQLTTTW